MDNSSGYERIAKGFIATRGQQPNGIGTKSVYNWIRSFPEKSTVLELGCGTGIPITKVIQDEGMIVYGIDASATLVNEFKKNFPHTKVECESVEKSLFFNRKFDAVIAWGLIFLLSEKAQIKVLEKTAKALKDGGKLLFTAPYQKTEWHDLMTKQTSISLGAKKYEEILSNFGLRVIQEFKDEGENYYFNAIKE